MVCQSILQGICIANNLDKSFDIIAELSASADESECNSFVREGRVPIFRHKIGVQQLCK